MGLQLAGSNDLTEPIQGPDKPFRRFEQHSSSLPFGQHIPLAQLAGPTYLTPQTLIQQVAYFLSDRLWTYSPESFDLDAAVKHWQSVGEKNIHEYVTSVEALETRSGAVSIALGYIFSKDFDLKKRHIPQSILASTTSLQYLRNALDQLSLLYSIANPFVAHVAAIDYQGGPNPGLVTDYASALSLADEIGLGVVSSSSAYETQHMSLLATILASVLPTIHIYDGIKVSRDTTQIIDVFDQLGLRNNYKAILDGASKLHRKHDSQEAKTSNILKVFNDELGTEYGLFEYRGHANADSVLVVFGTVEATLGSQIVQALEKEGRRVGILVVRIYRPFVEDEFIKALPKSSKIIGVLGQVQDRYAVADPAVQSTLYEDVLAAVTLSQDWSSSPTVIDVKYPREQVWTSASMASALQYISPKPLFSNQTTREPGIGLIDDAEVQGFIFWNLDNSPVASATTAFAKALSKDSSSNIVTSQKYDNLTQGGLQRLDIRKSKKCLDAVVSLTQAESIWVGDLAILNHVNVLGALKQNGRVILSLPNIKDEDLEKKLPVTFRKELKDLNAKLFILNPSAVEGIDDDPQMFGYLAQIAFLRVALPSLEKIGIQKLSDLNGNVEVLGNVSTKLDQGLRVIEVPEEWGKLVIEEEEVSQLLKDIHSNSFIPFDKIENAAPTLLKDSTTIVKSLIFKEAYKTQPSLRPDLTAKTWTIKLKEHRRLTPVTYDRNIMNLEFDLGESGMQYHIGDSLGIHPRNDEDEVQAFIKSYGLDPDAIFEASSRDDPSTLYAGTVYQTLKDQIDIFGKPSRQFYEALADFATNEQEKTALLTLTTADGATEFKRRSEVDTVTFVDILEEFPSARPPFHELVRIIPPLKRREYSIASCQKVTPNSVSLMIVTVLWTDPRGRDRFGLATRYLDALKPGDEVTVSLKPSVMKLPPKSTDPIIMAGLGTGLAPFRAFIQHRAWEAAQGIPIGPVLLYMGSRHQREEYCYGEEWEAYRAAGVISLLSCAFSRDQPQKIYIQDRMRETGAELEDAYISKQGAFYLCGPTWPVPDVTNVLEDLIHARGEREGKKVNTRREIETLKDQGRYVLEVY
jgi:sulfite reductase (NADPH) flavoprotein alpha-component